MEDLLQKPDPFGKTPLIDFKTSGILKIEGRSIIENVIDHYRPGLNWIRDFIETSPVLITVNISLEYFNTGSSKMILCAFKLLESGYHSGKTRVCVNWYHVEDDRDMYEAGYDYQSIVKIPFKIISLVEK
jgi:SiaC family regulatory phosphoprotein